VDRLANEGQLDGTLRIPHTVGDLELNVDLRSRRITAAVTVAAPEDRGGRARCTWLANQLSPEVDRRLLIESYARNARTPTTASLEAMRADKDILLGDDKRDPARFQLSLTREMGVARKTGRSAVGFIDSVMTLITGFYGTVIQNLTAWAPKAPKISRSPTPPEPDTISDERPRDSTPGGPEGPVQVAVVEVSRTDEDLYIADEPEAEQQ
jgi:hypothetical protein